MSNTPGGKGSAPRPYSVDPKTFAENFNRIFGNKSNPPAPAAPSSGATQSKEKTHA